MVFILNPNDPYVSVHIGTGICSANVTRSRRVLRQRRTIFFRNTTPHFRSLRPLPTTDLEKNKNCHIPDENIPWPRYTTRRIIRRKKKKYPTRYFRRLCAKEPHRSETISDEKCLYLYRSLRLGKYASYQIHLFWEILHTFTFGEKADSTWLGWWGHAAQIISRRHHARLL